MRELKLPESEEAVARTMTRRSMAGLGLLATLALGSLFLFWLQTRAIESSARVLNVSGRQRMLSQRIALLTDAFVGSRGAAQRERLRGELRRLGALMKAAHDGLVHGSDELRLPSSVPAEVEAIYFGKAHALDDQVRDYLRALEDLLAVPDPEPWHPAHLYVARVAAEGELLGSLDAVVSAFQAHAEARIARLQQAKYAVVVLTLVVIAVMRRRVVQPMVESVRRYIRELHRHHDRLAHVTRLSTMGEMSAGIAHEINQPLSAIMTYAQVCRRQIEAGRARPDELSETLEKICFQADRAGQVIRRVRSLVEDRETEKELVDLNAVVEEAFELAAADARLSGGRLELVQAAEPLDVTVDKVQIQQVVLNLIQNALEAVEAGANGEPVRVVTSRPEAGEVRVTVVDRGTGVPEGSGEELFEPFFTTKESGMGMGLSISRSIVRAHGGRLEFSRNPDRGSTFSFTIPSEER